LTEEISHVKKICRYLVIAFPFMLALPFASAQSVVDAAVGFGTAQAPASAQQIDTDTFLNYCRVGTSTNCEKTGKMSRFFMGFGANFMLWDHFGIGMEAKLQPAKQDFGHFSYGGYPYTAQTRTILYDVNGIWKPWSNTRASLQLLGGIGGASVRFAAAAQCGTGSVLSCSNNSSPINNSNHLQLHGGVGVQVYLTDVVFIRPQVDMHWVRNFSEFGRDTVPSYMVWLGYSFGSR
jgi:hypothetical protein